jgi:hypothetical protein
MKQSGKNDPLARLNLGSSGQGESDGPVIETEFCGPVPVSALRPKKEPEGPGFFAALFQGLVMIGMAACAFYIIVMFLPKPLYAVHAKRVYYTPFDMVRMSNLDSYTEEKQKHLLEYYAFSMRDLYSGKDFPETPAIAAVNRRCRNMNTPNAIFPTDGFQRYDGITKYVACILSVNTARFCDKQERLRLVSQLKAYSRFRQHLIAVERASGKKFITRKAEKIAARHSKWIRDSLAEADNATQYGIGEKVDYRILSKLSALVSKGYIHMDDFSWMGLFPPADYAEALKPSGPVQAPACGG